jgi:hypothetical protein
VQKDNRQDTLINFDASYLIDAIRNGSHGQDELTNYIICITNITVPYTFTTNNNGTEATNLDLNRPAYTNYYTRSSTVYLGVSYPFSVLTNGENIIGLLSTPKYTSVTYQDNPFGLKDPNGKTLTDPRVGSFYSNYISADLRSISGAATDEATNDAAYQFAFSYRVEPEILPSGWGMTYDYSWVDLRTHSNTNAWAMARNLQANLTQLRLRFRWPILPGTGRTGNGRQIARTVAAGTVTTNRSFVLDSANDIRLTNYFIEGRRFTLEPL